MAVLGFVSWTVTRADTTGNNFLQECGDLFSIHAVENPDSESEIKMLKCYAPSVPEELLGKLSDVFQELRELHQEVRKNLSNLLYLHAPRD